ncbi:MAG: helix-turn-helix domain-containing protein [Tannerellaceae bacterium]|jgi:transcriptional regulator with XRE-family HTH domain|nr:helix-turn-helix domain-containing protein [Tannerellaceae bacterium]
MKERIIRIMETEGLTAARFAEAIGTQRATLSHILSGRNNASLEIAQKILDRFPKLSPDWLLRGAGDMYRREKQPLIHSSLFSNGLGFSEEQEVPPPSPYDNGVHNPPSRVETPNPSLHVVQEPPPVSGLAQPQRRVTKIMIFYSDNTYDTFISEQTLDRP